MFPLWPPALHPTALRVWPESWALCMGHGCRGCRAASGSASLPLCGPLCMQAWHIVLGLVEGFASPKAPRAEGTPGPGPRLLRPPTPLAQSRLTLFHHFVPGTLAIFPGRQSFGRVILLVCCESLPSRASV